MPGSRRRKGPGLGADGHAGVEGVGAVGSRAMR